LSIFLWWEHAQIENSFSESVRGLGEKITSEIEDFLKTDDRFESKEDQKHINHLPNFLNGIDLKISDKEQKKRAAILTWPALFLFQYVFNSVR